MLVLLVVNLFKLGSVVLTLVELNGYFQQKLKIDFCNNHYTFSILYFLYTGTILPLYYTLSKLYFLYSLFKKVKRNVT